MKKSLEEWRKLEAKAMQLKLGKLSNAELAEFLAEVELVLQVATHEALRRALSGRPVQTGKTWRRADARGLV